MILPDLTENLSISDARRISVKKYKDFWNLNFRVLGWEAKSKVAGMIRNRIEDDATEDRLRF